VTWLEFWARISIALTVVGVLVVYVRADALTGAVFPTGILIFWIVGIVARSRANRRRSDG
jgi:hypothetical protein